MPRKKAGAGSADTTNCRSPFSNPAIALPCGKDHHGIPFWLQVIGRFRGDLDVFNAAEAMEYAFRANPILVRLQPDL